MFGDADHPRVACNVGRVGKEILDMDRLVRITRPIRLSVVGVDWFLPRTPPTPEADSTFDGAKLIVLV